MFRLDGKVAVVIGGAGGIGEIMAKALAAQGAKVAVASRNLQKITDIAKAIQTETKSETLGLSVDVTDKNSVDTLAENVLKKFGTVDILINSQGINTKRPADNFPIADWDALFNVNVRGTMLACSAFGKTMIAKKSGKIINISSVRVDMMTRALASEWAPHNINVNAIAPLLIRTPLAAPTLNDPEKLRTYVANVPFKRIGEPQDLAGLCIFLACQASDFITGQVIYLDGGLTAVG
jgi:NAD(P)-dependent dehydrogenase (short-subunit alcohol dehydrogenase family)